MRNIYYVEYSELNQHDNYFFMYKYIMGLKLFEKLLTMFLKIFVFIILSRYKITLLKKNVTSYN